MILHFRLIKVQGCIFAMDYLLWKHMSSTFPECHYQLEETGFVTCRKKSLTLGQICPLQSTMMTVFFVTKGNSATQ